MSEPLSLYARINISLDALKAFFSSPIPSAGSYDDWALIYAPYKYDECFCIDEDEFQNEQEWLKDAVSSANDRLKNFDTIGAYLTDIIENKNRLPSDIVLAAPSYDEKTYCWTLYMVEFSENFYDALEFLSVLRHVAKFKDRESEDEDFILSFEYFFENEVMRNAIKIEKGQSTILASLPEPYEEEANNYFKKLLQMPS